MDAMQSSPASARTASRTSRARELAAARVRAGASRTGANAVAIARTACAAALAYGLSQLVWGHHFPFFAAIAAYVVVGFTVEKKMRKMFEMAAGVLMGVLLGEVFHMTIGGGAWQVAVAIFIAAMLARFIDKGVIFAVQAGIQAMFVMIMPASPLMTPQSRFLDAVTGVVVGIAVYMLFSGDPRRLQQRAADRFFTELEAALVGLAEAARTGSGDLAESTLKGLRSRSQSLTDQWDVANDAANEVATFSPSAVRHATSVRRLALLLVGSDRAMRNLRVIARRERAFLAAVEGEPHERLADALEACREAVTELRSGISQDVDFTGARRGLRLFCSYLTPEILLIGPEGAQPGRRAHFEGISLVIQLRSLAFDLLEATGLTHEEASRFLPSLIVAGDGDVIGPRPETAEMRAIEPPATTAALELLITDRSDPERRR